MTDDVQEFNLAQFEASDTATLELDDPRGQPLLVNGARAAVVLYGPGSAAHVRAQARADAASQARVRQALMGKPAKETPEDQRQQQAERLAACTVALQNFPVPGGPLALYGNPRLGYITAQVDRFLGDWANFTPGSAKP